MFTSTLVVSPSFLGGILVGLNKRNHPKFNHDPWAPYKVLSLASGFGFVKILANAQTPIEQYTPKKALLSAMILPPLASGATFCMGLMLTRILEKNIL
jgi:hypothetical protein